MAVIPLPAPLRVRAEPGYLLKVFDPTGKALIREFSRGVPGISGDIIASADPLLGCVGCTFDARPDVANLGDAGDQGRSEASSRTDAPPARVEGDARER